MREKPFFSIVTVTRNDKRGITKTLESISKQKYQYFEWLVVDGASTDETVQFLEEHLISIPQLNFVSEPDTGIYDAMNKGFSRSTGDLILFLNSGDQLCGDNVLQFVANEWQQDPSWVWGYGAIRLVDTNYEPFSAYVNAPFVKKMFTLGREFIPHPSSVFSRDLLLQIGLYDDAFEPLADQELYFRALNISLPHVWVDFLVDFLVGGVSSNINPMQKELIWHGMRKKNEVLIGNVILDYCYSVLVGLKMISLSKINLILSSHKSRKS